MHVKSEPQVTKGNWNNIFRMKLEKRVWQ